MYNCQAESCKSILPFDVLPYVAIHQITESVILKNFIFTYFKSEFNISISNLGLHLTAQYPCFHFFTLSVDI